METKKNNFVNLGDTDKKCQHPAGEGTQGASKMTKSLKTPKWYARARLTARFISQIRRRA